MLWCLLLTYWFPICPNHDDVRDSVICELVSNKNPTQHHQNYGSLALSPIIPQMICVCFDTPLNGGPLFIIILLLLLVSSWCGVWWNWKRPQLNPTTSHGWWSFGDWESLTNCFPVRITHSLTGSPLISRWRTSRSLHWNSVSATQQHSKRWAKPSEPSNQPTTNAMGNKPVTQSNSAGYKYTPVACIVPCNRIVHLNSIIIIRHNSSRLGSAPPPQQQTQPSSTIQQ